MLQAQREKMIRQGGPINYWASIKDRKGLRKKNNEVSQSVTLSPQLLHACGPRPVMPSTAKAKLIKRMRDKFSGNREISTIINNSVNFGGKITKDVVEETDFIRAIGRLSPAK